MKKIELRWLVGFIIAFACCAFYAALISFKTMPISEGWYSEYAWQINHGNLPYRDFEYLFFPLYMFIIAGFTKIFGYSIIALRILGIFVFGGIGAMLYCLFSKLFDNFSGLIAAVIAALFLQSEVNQVFYDYIRFHDLFAIITAYLLLCVSCRDAVRIKGQKNFNSLLQTITSVLLMLVGIIGFYQLFFINQPTRKIIFVFLFVLGAGSLIISLILKKNKNEFLKDVPFLSFLCGVFVAAECMVKQSNGTLMIVFIMAYLLYCAVTLRDNYYYKSFVGVVYGICFSFGLLLLYLVMTNSLDSFVKCCFGNALAAKGGLASTLFNWIPGALISFREEKEKAIIIILYLYIMIDKYIRKKDSNSEYNTKPIVIGGCMLMLTSWIFVNYENLANKAAGQIDTYLPALVFFLGFAAFFLYAFKMLLCRLTNQKLTGIWAEYFPAFAIFGVIFAQGYGSGMSGGLATSQTAIGLGMLIALCIHVAVKVHTVAVISLLTLCSLFLGSTFIGGKTIQTYYWWGLTQDALSQHTESVEVPLLKGIKMRETDKICYETIYKDVVTNTDCDDLIFSFPQCPIVYTMTGRHSSTYSKVQWFDVSSRESIMNDIEELRRNLPKMIICVDMPEDVYTSHEALFSGYHTRIMKDALINEIIPENNYKKLHSISLGNDYIVQTYLLDD